MANIQGKISSSLDVAMQDVTMSFKSTPVFYSASLLTLDVSGPPYSASIILPPNQENDILIISTLVGAATADIWAPDCQSIAKVSGSQLNAEWFWKRVTASQDTQIISSSANNLYGVATVWRGCVTESTPYLEPVVKIGQVNSNKPIAASVTASEDNTLLVSFANIEDQWTFSGFPPSDWSATFNFATTTGTDCRLSGITQGVIPISGSGTEQVNFGTLQAADYWGTLTLLLKSSDTSSGDVTYTDSNGIYSQSFASDWIGKLAPISSSYGFFEGPNNSLDAVAIEVSASDITQDFIGVKDFSSGSGIIDNPYTILDHEDMQNVRYRTGSNTSGQYACYHLGADIDLSPISEWKTINAYWPSFYGYFRGNNYTISNMNITEVEHSSSQIHFGLFGELFHTSSEYCGDVNFNSCSIDLTDGLEGASSRYYGIFIANSENTNIVKNVHVKNSNVSHNRTSDSANCRQYLGGIIGKQDGAFTSCSVEGTTVHYNTTVASSNQPASGMLIGQTSANLINYCFVKSSSLFTNRNSSATNAGLIAGGASTYIKDCYALNCAISGAMWVTPVASGFNASSARIYAAGINFGNTVDSEKYPAYVSGSFSTGDGSIYWESGINIFTHSTGSDSGVYSASVDDIKSIRYLREDRGAAGFDFDNVWARNDQFQDGYPFFYWEAPIITSSSVEGSITSSVHALMENVTMSFHNNDGVVNYSAFTNEFGNYTQSVDVGWSGSVQPTASADANNAEFFRDLAFTASYSITDGTSDKIFDSTWVKDFDSGSGNNENPYIILDHEDMHNVRYRTGSATDSTHPHYKLGSDIDLTPIGEWTPIPSFIGDIFYGGFDGDGYTISSMSISNPPALGTSRKHFGLFSRYYPVSSGSRNINFDNCSINLSGTLPNNSGDMLYGILVGHYYKNYITSPDVKIRNVHVNHSIVRVNKSSPAVVAHWMGGIAGNNDQIGTGGIYGNGLISCSVQNTIIDMDLHGGGATSVRIGGLTGENWVPDGTTNLSRVGIFYCFIKDCTIHSNTSTNGNYFGGFAGYVNALVRDSYILNCNMSSSYRIGPGGWGMNKTSTRVYVAGINYGNTDIDDKYPFVNYDYDDGPTNTGFCYWESGSEVFTKSASVVGVTGSAPSEMILSESFKTFDFESVWLRNDINNDGYPYLGYEVYTPTVAGLTLHYDSRIGYVSASNTWTDLSGDGVDATTENTFPSGGHLYFGTEFGPSSASFSTLKVSSSFAIEMFIAPTTESEKMHLFSTISGTFPRIDGYLSESNAYFGFQSASTSPVTYISSSSPLNTNKFNHLAFQVAPDSGTLWVNGTFEPSESFTVGDSVWNGGTIGILDTIQENQYYGYIDVFKVWNGTTFNSSVQNTVNEYHASRSYFDFVPPVTYPSP